MKKLTFILLLVITESSFGQVILIDSIKTSFDGINLKEFGLKVFEDYTVKSKYDTTILNKGKEKCAHSFVKKDAKEGMYSSPYYSCLVNHEPEGCPDKWEHYKAICRNCLRHIEVKETREAVKRIDEYDALLEKLNNQK